MCVEGTHGEQSRDDKQATDDFLLPYMTIITKRGYNPKMDKMDRGAYPTH